MTKRITLRGEHHLTHVSHFFTALVANSGDSSDWIGDKSRDRDGHARR
jgi:hypothetical protein